MKNAVSLTYQDINKKIPILENELIKVLKTHTHAKELQKRLIRLKRNVKLIELPINDAIKQILIDREIREDFQFINIYVHKSEISYESMILNVPSSLKIKTFIKYSNTFDDKQYWKELASAYILQNYLKISRKKLVELFSASKEFRDELMNAQEKIYLSNLPQVVTIYRGGALSEQKTDKYGISWSLDKEVAVNFSAKKKITTNKEMTVHELKINRDNIIAIFLQRGEDEVIWF